MFEAAGLGRTLSRDAYKKRVPALRAALLDAQQRLSAAPFPVIVVFAGVDGAGKGETVNLLNEWMDPRWIVTRAFGEPSDEERERPEAWRYWRELPPKGRIGLFLSSWYWRPVSIEPIAAYPASSSSTSCGPWSSSRRCCRTMAR